MRRSFVMLVVAMVCWRVHEISISACPARSAPSHKPTDPEAVVHLSAGNRAYNASLDKRHPLTDDERQRQLARAIAEYTAGQRCDDAFVFDFNLGQAYAALGQPREALDHLLRFLDRAELDADDRAKVEKRIATVDPTGLLRAERSEKQAVAARAVGGPTARPVGAPTAPAALGRSAEHASPALPPQPSAAPATERAQTDAPALSATTDAAPRSSVRWGHVAGWSLTTLGLAGGGVTTYLVIDAQNLDHQATDAETNHDASVRNQLANRAASRRHTAIFVGIGSGVAIATGLVLALWPGADRAPTQASWHVGVTGNGLAVAGQF